MSGTTDGLTQDPGAHHSPPLDRLKTLAVLFPSGSAGPPVRSKGPHNMTCQHCGQQLPPASNSSHRRRWCSDACRKRAARARPTTPPPSAPTGPVESAVRTLLAELPTSGVDAARAALAIALAALVDSGSVPAGHELRGLLNEFDALEDEDIAAFRRSIQTPRPIGNHSYSLEPLSLPIGENLTANNKENR